MGLGGASRACPRVGLRKLRLEGAADLSQPGRIMSRLAPPPAWPPEDPREVQGAEGPHAEELLSPSLASRCLRVCLSLPQVEVACLSKLALHVVAFVFSLSCLVNNSTGKFQPCLG